MDPLSQFIVGGVAGAAFSLPLLRKIRGAAATANAAPAVGASILCAGFAAMAPDLDIFIRSADYPLLALKYHRHFTHALPMAPLLALLLWLPLWLLFRPFGLDKARVLLLALLGVATHGALDAMTNYGTHLLWPFTNARVSWNIISIIDPVFTLTLVLAAIIAAVKNSRRPLLLACVFMLGYWSLGIYQRSAAEAEMLQLADSRGHTVERHQVKPSFGNLLLWRAQYESDGRIYTDAVNVTPLRTPKVYEGTSTPLLVADDSWLQRLPQPLQQDARDFIFFSDGWVSPVGTTGTIIGDMRFAALPNAPGPMWALQLDKLTATGHGAFVFFPRTQPGDWRRFGDMLLGK